MYKASLNAATRSRILSNVLLRADNDGPGCTLALSATDMDLEIVEQVAARVERTGRTTAPAHTLYDIVRKLPDGAELELDASGERSSMVLRCGRSTFTLACLPPEDYPIMASGELPNNFTLSAPELKSLIDRTRFAISTEETRYYLNGIYLHATKTDEVPVIRAVATDGHRLARVEMLLPEGAAGIPEIIIPRKTVLEIRKLVDEADEDIQLSLSETKIRFVTGDATLTSKLIDGTFPDYDRVIPTANDKVLEVKCKDFSEAVDRVSTISTEKSRAVKLSITPGANGGSLAISATSPRKRDRNRGTRGALSQRGARNRVQLTISARHRRPDRRRRRSVCHVRFSLSDNRPRPRRPQRSLRTDADAGLSSPAARKWIKGDSNPIYFSC